MPPNEKPALDVDAVYTAEGIGSYKPSDRNFDYMLAKLETLGFQNHNPAHGGNMFTIMARRTNTASPPAGYTAAMIRRGSEQPSTRV